MGLKSLVESLRMQTLRRAGLQQIQLDVHYLRPKLRRSALPFLMVSRPPGCAFAVIIACLGAYVQALYSSSHAGWMMSSQNTLLAYVC